MSTNSPTPHPELPQLDEDTVRTLRSLRLNPDKMHFYAYVASLRHNRWPLRAISEPLEVSRSIVAIWQSKFDASVHLPVTETLPESVPKSVKPVYKKFAFTDAQAEELAQLAEEASKVRRYTDTNSPSRGAAETLEQLLIEYKDQGASLQQMADAADVSRSSIAQRLRKYN